MTKIQASPVVYLPIDFSLVQAERALFDVHDVALQGYELSRDGHRFELTLLMQCGLWNFTRQPRRWAMEQSSKLRDIFPCFGHEEEAYIPRPKNDS